MDKTDHDLLIEIRTQLRILLAEYVESQKDHEKRIRLLERAGAIAAGALLLLELLLRFLPAR